MAVLVTAQQLDIQVVHVFGTFSEYVGVVILGKQRLATGKIDRGLGVLAAQFEEHRAEKQCKCQPDAELEYRGKLSGEERDIQPA